MFEGNPAGPTAPSQDAPAEGRKSHKFKAEISSSETSKPSPIFRGREMCVIDEELSS
jgi:hypothetical protein